MLRATSVLTAAMLCGATATAQAIEQTVVAAQLDSPVAMAISPDGRLFVAQQGGAVRVVQDDVLLPQPFAVVPTIADDEEGLTGIALDPAFAQNGHVYLRVTVPTPTRHNRVIRLTAAGNVAAPASEVTVFDLDTNQAHFHLGGAMRFGPDGMLYLATGDNNTPFFGGNLGSTHGKMLRIAPDGSIPADNPFYQQLSGDRRAIWALGLRNPFGFAIHPGNGRVFVNDVGSFLWEEVNDIVAGGNYGWPANEGPGGPAGTIDPIHAYQHFGQDGGCAATGAAFYAPVSSQLPAQFLGHYLFTEYCRAEIRALHPSAPQAGTTLVADTLPGPVDLAVAPDGALYYLTRGNSASSGGTGFRIGSLVKITQSGSFVPSFTTYDDGCVGTLGVPYLAPNGAPRLATPGFELRVGDVLPHTLAALHLGLSDLSWAFGPLPLDLGPFGMPGCRMLTSGDQLFAVWNGAGTEAPIPLPIPNQGALLGITVYLQGFAFDFAANVFGGVVSPGVRMRIGN